MTRPTLLSTLMPAVIIAAGLQTPESVKTPTQSVSGIAIQADTRIPLPGTRIELVREDYQRLTTGHEKPCNLESEDDVSEKRRFAFSDAEGKFTFADVESGAYFLFAEHEGFLKFAYGQNGAYPLPRVLRVGLVSDTDQPFSEQHTLPKSTGTGRPNEEQMRRAAMAPGAVAAIVDFTSPAKIKKPTLQELKLPLSPAPSITGVVLDETGSSLAAATVQAYQFRYTPLGRTLKSVRTTLTNDEGRYRLFWLDPGRYLVAAGYSDYGLQPWMQGLQLTPNLPHADAGYPMMFYPAAPTASDAVYVALNPGAETIADFRLRSRLRLNTQVRLVGAGIPSSTSLVFVPTGGDLCAAIDYAVRPQRNGAFEIRDVPEGLYVTAAMSGKDFISDLQTVEVKNGKPVYTALPVMMPMTIHGTVYFKDTPMDVDLTTARVNLARKGLDLHQVQNTSPDLKTGNFAIEGVGPGNYYVTMDLPSGFYVASAGASKFELRDGLQKCAPEEGIWSPKYGYLDPHGHLDASRPLTIPQTLPGATECLAIKVAFGKRLHGFVYDRSDHIVPGALVVAFPKSVWAKSDDAGATPPDRILTATTDDTGFFAVQGLVDSEYQIYAFENIDPNEVYNPALLDRFRNRESFEYRLFTYNGAWVQQVINTMRLARLDTCDSYNDFVRTVCFITVIPAADTADIK